MDKVMIMKDADNVATCLADMKANERVTVTVAGGEKHITLTEDVPFGHKFALADIAAGAEVLKYGAVMGLASKPIAAGQYVHVHNVESARARGDKAHGDKATGDKA